MNRASDDRRSLRVLGGIVVLTAAVLWLPPLRSSLWMDETVTHWLVSDGWSETLHRSLEFEGESPLYFLILAAVRRLIGTSELALRLPSLIAIASATYLMWRLGRRLLGREAGGLAAVVFVSIPSVVFAASDARSYSMGVLAVVASTFALVRWADSGSRADATAYVVLTAVALYIHYFTGTALAAHAVYVMLRRDRIRLGRFLIAVLSVCILMIPAIPHLNTLFFERREMLQLPHEVSLELFFSALFPPLLVGAIALGALIARQVSSLAIDGNEGDPKNGSAFSMALWLVPPSILAAVTLLGVKIFEGRYLYFAGPGLALTAAVLVRRVMDTRARLIVVTGVSIAAMITLSTVSHTGDDWPAAVEIERRLATESTPVLFRSSLVESANISWLSRQDKREYLLAPLSAYAVRGRIIPIPHALTADARQYIAHFSEVLRSAPTFILLNDNGSFAPWLEGRFPERVRRDFPGGGSVTVTIFVKRT